MKVNRPFGLVAIATAAGVSLVAWGSSGVLATEHVSALSQIVTQDNANGTSSSATHEIGTSTREEMSSAYRKSSTCTRLSWTTIEKTTKRTVYEFRALRPHGWTAVYRVVSLQHPSHQPIGFPSTGCTRWISMGPLPEPTLVPPANPTGN